MTQPYNALYGPPQAPVDNALYYDDTQGMPRQRPADPLRWLADYVGQNKDLPAPQFFMDPRALSVRNMLHSGLGTAANWLDGTKDPRLVGPAEMVSPLGLAGMGMGVANAVTRPGRDFRIAEALARQHPEVSAVGTIPRYAPLRDASNPTSAAHVYDYGMLPGASRPANVMADNAKGSAPGTVVNSLGDFEIVRTPGGTGDTMYTLVPRGKSLGEDDAGYFNVKPSQRNPAGIEVTNAYLEEPFRRQGLGTKIYDQIERDFGRPLYPSPTDQLSEHAANFWRKRAPERLSDAKPVDDAWVKFKGDLHETLQRSQSTIDDATATLSRWETQSAQLREQLRKDMEQAAADDAAWDKARARPSLVGRLLGRNRSDPSASAPGLAANSTQQDDQGVMSILRRYGLAD